MNISQIKQEISQKTGATLVALNMVRQLEEDKVTPTEWTYHWDNSKRLRIAMHDDLLKQLKASPERNDLAYKTTAKEATTETEAYTIYTVIIPKNLEATF